MSIDESLFDIRVVARNIARGKVTQEQYEAYLGSLEDISELGAETQTAFVHKIEDEEDLEADKSRSRRRRR
ncbi:MAG: hypothetical protein ACI8S6_004470 [Myxococcota bacterium]|jgi:hypothetical protein